MLERRKLVRRESDRQLLKRVAELDGCDRRLGTDCEDAKRKRRHAIRHNCRAIVKMPIGHAAGHSDDWTVDTVDIEGRVLDLSVEGASVFTKQEFSVGAELMVIIKPLSGDRIEVKASVRWVKAIPEKRGFAAGVKFREIPAKEQTKIAGFLHHLVENAGL